MAINEVINLHICKLISFYAPIMPKSLSFESKLAPEKTTRLAKARKACKGPKGLQRPESLKARKDKVNKETKRPSPWGVDLFAI